MKLDGVHTKGSPPQKAVVEGNKPGMTGPPRFLMVKRSGQGWVTLVNEAGDIGEFDVRKLLNALYLVGGVRL